MPKNKHKNYTRKCKDFRKPLDRARISRKPYYNGKRGVFKVSRKITIKGSRQTKKHKPKYIGGLSKDTDENIINELKSIVARYIDNNPEFKNAQPNMLSVIKKLTTDSSASSDQEVELDPDVTYFKDKIAGTLAEKLTQPDLDILQKLAIRIIDQNDLSFVGKGLKYLQDFISACVLYFINDIELNDSTEFLFRTRITNKMPYVTVKRMKDGSEAVYDVNEMFALIKEELKDGTAYESKVKENLLKKITIDSNFGLETVEKGETVPKVAKYFGAPLGVEGIRGNFRERSLSEFKPPAADILKVTTPAVFKINDPFSIGALSTSSARTAVVNTVKVNGDTKIAVGDQVTFLPNTFFSFTPVTGIIKDADDTLKIYTIEETITGINHPNIIKAKIQSKMLPTEANSDAPPSAVVNSAAPPSDVVNPIKTPSLLNRFNFLPANSSAPPVNTPKPDGDAKFNVYDKVTFKETSWLGSSRKGIISSVRNNTSEGKGFVYDIEETVSGLLYTNISEDRIKHEEPAAVTPAVGKLGIRNLLSFSSNAKPPNPQSVPYSNLDNTDINSDDQTSSSASASDPTVSIINLSNDKSPKFKTGESVTFKTEKSRLSFSKKGTIKDEPTFNKETGFVYDINGADTKIYTAIKEELIESASPTVVNSSKKPPTQTFVLGNKVSFKSGIVPFSKTVTGKITKVINDDLQFNTSAEILYNIDGDDGKPYPRIEGKKLTLVSSGGGRLRRTRRKHSFRRTRRNPSLRRTPERGTKQDFLRMKRSK